MDSLVVGARLQFVNKVQMCCSGVYDVAERERYQERYLQLDSELGRFASMRILTTETFFGPHKCFGVVLLCEADG